jgi:hypothetical protein
MFKLMLTAQREFIDKINFFLETETGSSQDALAFLSKTVL